MTDYIASLQQALRDAAARAFPAAGARRGTDAAAARRGHFYPAAPAAVPAQPVRFSPAAIGAGRSMAGSRARAGGHRIVVAAAVALTAGGASSIVSRAYAAAERPPPG